MRRRGEEDLREPGPSANIEHTWRLPAESDHQQHPHNHRLDSHSALCCCSLVERWGARTIRHGEPQAGAGGGGVVLHAELSGDLY